MSSASTCAGDEAPLLPSGSTPVTDPPWRRLDRRMIAVDAAQAALSLVPLVLATWLFGVDTDGGLWPVLAVAGFGVAAAAADAYRWAVTRYRITDEFVERRSGLVVRSYRSVRRDRIRSVDIHARIRHRIGGLRIVTIGAGQQAAAGESAFALDAVSIRDAQALHALLLGREASPATSSEQISPDVTREGPPAGGTSGGVQVLARFRPSWVVYNMVSVWAYVMAAGLLWGTYWLLSGIGVDPDDVLDRVLDREALGPGWSVAVGVAAVTLVGVVGLGMNFFVEYWRFELARVPGDDGGSLLRTRHGLLTTREVARDELRMRGLQISEPLLWRWMGMADTTVITTGLSMWSMSQPAAILPRGPIRVARSVAGAVLGSRPSPLDADLHSHPPAALRRRLWWASLTAVLLVAVAAWFAGSGALPTTAVAVVAAVAFPVAVAAAVLSYRALGHTIDGEYVVLRSGLVSRATTALQRSAVSTVVLRESVLQRRLGLTSVAVMTSAGYGGYDAPDLAADRAVVFANAAAPGLLHPFLSAVGEPA